MIERQLDLLAPHCPDSRFQVRQSPRAKHLSINVSAHGVVEVVVPARTGPAIVERFVRQHRGWIDRTLAELQRRHPRIDRDMPDTIDLRAIGQQWQVRYGFGRRRVRGKLLELAASRDDRPRCRTELQRWLRETGRAHLVPWLQTKSRALAMDYGRVQVRGQRTRWGSYSSTGTLSINYCLLFLDRELTEHVFVHELCHTRVMNHSRRFWQLVSEHSPDYRVLEKRLDRAWAEVPGWVGLH